MAHYCKNSKSNPSTILQEAVKFFGPDGLGLQVKEEVEGKDECCASLSSSSRHIFVKAIKNGKGSEIEVETSKCDKHVEQFLEKV